MRRPVNSPYVVTTEFGVLDSNAKFGRHSGIDYAVPLNRPIYAPASGTLQNIISVTGGNMVVIYDGQFYHRLMHNNSFSRANGHVDEGAEVAKAGTTGLSTGVHCHWDINKEGITPTSFAAFVPPADWLAGKYNKGEYMITDTDNEFGRWNKLFFQIRGRNASRTEFRNSAVGQTWLRAMEILSDDPEADKATNAQEVGKTAIKDNWVGQIAQLTAKVNELGKVVDLQAKEIAKLNAQLALQSEDTANLNKFGETLRWFVQRLGLSK